MFPCRVKDIVGEGFQVGDSLKGGTVVDGEAHGGVAVAEFRDGEVFHMRIHEEWRDGPSTPLS